MSQVRRRQFLIAICITAGFVSAFAQDTMRPLTNADVIKLVRAKLPESTIILSIQSRPSAFDTSPEALISLTQNRVPTKVIEAMLQTSIKPTPTQASKAARPTPSQNPVRAVAIQPGGLWGSSQTRIEVDRVFLLNGDNRTEMKFTQPGTRRQNLVFANQQYAVLPGGKARLRTDNRSPEFEMIVPNNVEISSIVSFALLAERSEGVREIMIGSKFGTGGINSATQSLPNERVMRVIHEKAADQSSVPDGYDLYRIKAAEPLKPGEYAFIVSKSAAQHLAGAAPFAGAGVYNYYELGID